MIASEAVAAWASAATEPAKVLVSGGVGTGKTSVLVQVRTALRAAGITVIARAPRDGDPEDAAVVIDDAHLLATSDLEMLVDVVSDPARTMVIAAEPLFHQPALVALRTAMSREAPQVALDPLTVADVHRIASDAVGVVPRPNW